MKEIIVKILESAFKKEKIKLNKEKILELIEVPRDATLGDFAFPCFVLASQLKSSPNQIAIKLREAIGKTSEGFEDIQSVGPYLNFFVDRKTLAIKTVQEVIKLKEKYGTSNDGKGKLMVIDLSSPNIAKPFGIGHLRSTIIGNSLGEIAKKLGYKVIKINYLGDWGTQFGKMIVGWKKFGNETELKKDPIKFMLKLYVEGNKEEYEQEARDWFKKLENGDKEATDLWKKFKELSLKEFDNLYKLLGINFDEISGESFYNNKMDKTIKELRDKKLLKESDGALVVDLEKYGLGVSLIKKSDGATLYATRDITAAIDRFKRYGFSRMIYEVGQEQKLHFQQFFKILELMGYDWAKNCIHVYHGLYLDKDGKKFATRKGKTVLMEDILGETIELAKKRIEDKNPKLKNKKEAAKKIAIGAIFYGDLKNFRANDMVFDLDRFLEFEGNTGPYLLYSYARAKSILRKVKPKKTNILFEDLEEKEIELVKKISEFSSMIEKAYEQMNPSIIANYAYQLSQTFNEFYHECPVIGSDKEKFRLMLVEAFSQVLKNSLALLGIETLEEM
jgi:arginyl-tRNA synthetase